MTARSHKSFVLDSSAVVALLVDGGSVGQWVADVVSGAELLSAPDLMRYEVANIFRRQLLAGVLDETAATLAYRDLGDLDIDIYPYQAAPERIWALRRNVTVYDASYVAIAELVQAPLITLDAKLAKASGPRCEFITYQGS